MCQHALGTSAEGTEPAREQLSELALANWRREVFEMYRQVRLNPDPAAARARWREQRDVLFRARRVRWRPMTRCVGRVSPTGPVTLEGNVPYKGVKVGSEVRGRSAQEFKDAPTIDHSSPGSAVDVLVALQYRVDGFPNTYVDFVADKRRGAGDKLGTCTFDRDRRESPDTFPWDRFPFSEDEPETTAGPDHMACGFDLAGQPFFLQPTHVRLPQ